ncbi:cupin domain-containing protein [Thermodesulforhabdus norvegica]|uniref:Transcriptional regulator, XRE family with cupin sensor n=1 Tax=Thermodesulforhabdus norvegica TaxID=39841 RepID=A0A1I4UWK7_9BACT|nr:cupin domain-containing protein [Thermodesulforhabdus norvegica]SFM93331.1 transcriptional regulator, XRE family with cupin sensor [Thermodesulforhabdus norvegica]
MEAGLKIGEKLKRLRMESGLTQEELANRAYLTKGFISQLERDLTSPSISTLKAILDVLGVGLAEFFSDVRDTSTIGYARRRVLSTASTDECSVFYLLPRATGRLMDPVLVRLAPGVKTPEETAHPGEEFGFVLKGRIVLWLDRQNYRLKNGDCFYFKSSTRHWVENVGQSEAELLWVVSPTRFEW